MAYAPGVGQSGPIQGQQELMVDVADWEGWHASSFTSPHKFQAFGVLHLDDLEDGWADGEYEGCRSWRKLYWEGA